MLFMIRKNKQTISKTTPGKVGKLIIDNEYKKVSKVKSNMQNLEMRNFWLKTTNAWI